jgi:cyclic beta-1,2-glucan synthetase
MGGTEAEEAIRAELLTGERLLQHARSIATSDEVGPRARPTPVGPRIRQNARVLTHAYHAIAGASREDRAITPGAEWLLDNVHVVEDQIAETLAQLPPDGRWRLPVLTRGPRAGYARILNVAWHFVAHNDSRFDGTLLAQFLNAYQEVRPLTIDELWAVPTALRIIYIENLRRIARRIEWSQQGRRIADQFADRLLAGAATSQARIVNRPFPQVEAALEQAFVVQLVQRLQFHRLEHPDLLQALGDRLARRDLQRDEAVAREHAAQAAANLTVMHAIMGLRGIATLNWRTFFERVSLVHHVLSGHESYCRLDFESRDRCRQSIAELARGCDLPEEGIAAELATILDPPDAANASVEPVVTNAQAGPVAADLLSEPAYYLVAAGRRDLERRLRYRPPPVQRLRRFIALNAIYVYPTAILAVTALVLAIAALLGAGLGLGGWRLGLLMLAAALPASDIATTTVNGAFSRRFVPRHLLRYRCGEVPGDARTFVVVPCLLTDLATIRSLCVQLESHYLSNGGGAVHLALLTDWVDAPQARTADDDALLESAREGIDTLNRKYPADGHARFHLLHRRRLWNEQESCFMGWERKRGKLHEFNRLLRGADDTTFEPPQHPLPRDVRYVLTLDADTKLPIGVVNDLVGIALHPLNRPRFDASRRRVVGGYAILQPRITASLPRRTERSAFQKLYAGAMGTDPYVGAVSDVYQDLFGRGIYTGKGLYEVDAFEASLHERVPENSVLSHDLFESAYARCALVSDVEFFDEFPSHLEVAAERQHRWTRGDWQLLPWLAGSRGDDLPAVSRWQMIDNLRRSLVTPCALATLVLAYVFGQPLPWLGFVYVAFAFPHLYGRLRLTLGEAFERPPGYTLTELARDVAVSLSVGALALALLAHSAWLMLDAIARTLWRLLASRRRLLEWTSASQLKAARTTALNQFVWTLRSSTVVVLGVAAVLAAFAPNGVTPALPLLLLWWLAPLIAQRMSVPAHTARTRPLPAEQEQRLRDIARRTWGYFSAYVEEGRNWLPPDNVQETPQLVVAERVSPTNFGLYLLAAVTARDFGWIDLRELAGRLEPTLDTLERMERHHGHFLNWYETRTLHPLPPRYLSTVDSGNLAGHLLAVARACDDAAGGVSESDPATAERLERCAQRARRLFHAMDFAFLFDRERQLFHIGYNVDRAQLDTTHYDLLASESRLASFLAIAKGDVAPSHWMRLGRRLTATQRGPVLVSWSGSMFEYLMPSLVMATPTDSLLDLTCRRAVACQIDYGAKRQVPWGVSESAYIVRDLEMTYQYAAFGVPGLGLKRGLGADLVVAPYATALASMYDPVAAARNFERLRAHDGEGELGFYEAIDFTPERLPHDARYEPVRAYMAHHQGMSLVALGNALLDNVARRRFHREPLVLAAELLLQEATTRRPVVRHIPEHEVTGVHGVGTANQAYRSYATPHLSAPATQVLSNGRYSVMVTAAGSGYSRHDHRAVTRWREDPTRDAYGSYLYLRDVATGTVWSAGYQPTAREPARYEVVMQEDRVRIARDDHGIQSRLEITVSPEDDADVRRLTLKNLGDAAREIEVTSYAEIVLAPPAADAAHPAFSNLFIETEAVPAFQALIASRRPRSSTDPRLFAVHCLGTGAAAAGAFDYETDRAQFIGRGRTTRNPIALERSGELSRTTGPVLDPVFCLRTRIVLQPGAEERLLFTTLVADSREQAQQLIEKYRELDCFRRASTLAFTRAQIQLNHLKIEIGEAHLFQTLASRALLWDRSARPSGLLVQAMPLPSSGLWRLGISGDRPIVLLRLAVAEDRSIVVDLLRAHQYWREKRLAIDVVILNEKGATYAQQLQTDLEALVRAHGADPRGGDVHVIRTELVSDDERAQLAACCRVILDANQGSLAEQVQRFQPVAREPPPAPREETPGLAPPLEPPPLELGNGIGGFADDGREYVMVLEGEAATPAPWCNVLANERFGVLVSESGAGYAWCGNSRENQLHPWSNDAVSDSHSEAIYLRDEETGAYWTPTPGPVRLRESRYVVRHGLGYTRFEHRVGGLETDLSVHVAPDAAVKVTQLRIRNVGRRTRRISVTAYVEWSLGSDRTVNAPYIATEWDRATRAIFARNPWNIDFGKGVAFLATGDGENLTATADRAEFLGRLGHLRSPAAMNGSRELSGVAGGALDPCAALRTVREIEPGQETVIQVFLGQTDSREAARLLIARLRATDMAAQLRAVQENWRGLLGTIRIETPDRAFDILANHWLLYQVLSSRYYARCGFYQAGGAYGFRDQLQDSQAFVLIAPSLARAHLLRAASRQFAAGDVQHWWHPPSGRGVRTHISDDRVWLAYTAARYVEVTGDAGVLDEAVAYLEGPAPGPGQEDLHYVPEVAEQREDLYAHCARALDASLRTGEHGLPLIGGGDWNDGMNRVGHHGRGESVWLGWFLIETIRRFVPLAQARGDEARALVWEAHAAELRAAIEREAWDGEWYRRAFLDDGTPIGTAAAGECRIDSIAQSWAVISGAAKPQRARRAMDSLYRYLVRPDAGLVLLLTPPFDTSAVDPGYIKGYVPGVRENGGQYTHAAVWSAIAFSELGRAARAFEIVSMLNPINRSTTASGIETYRVEPYVIAADVYSGTPHTGRGGWTWYTGAAGWLYRAMLEHVLGVRITGDELRLAPQLPAGWERCSVELRRGKTTHRIRMTRNPHQQGVAIRLDGVESPTVGSRGRSAGAGVVPLVGDGLLHDVDVVIGQVTPGRQEDEPDGYTEQPDEDSFHATNVDRSGAGG